ncbi:hypothetical protein BU14_0239s0009 [Porphyra umbilicalis]|uniref:Uncharacterized protein n=1 Tax=Porphyra umbilicalis TaxID=2786 RepID=A0A1X6P3B2_PORUM|nr:hypothetical protein BU14_0239s0009 [Porphyra umbilicalis]|eukprot:OSX75354.1 hypothetical protein BU14_0239s0009 [Porphyra umbilicalis]
MTSKNNSNGTIAKAIDVKKSTVAYVAQFVRGGAGAAKLWEALCEEWDAIPASFFTSLIQSMPRRVQAVVASKGSGTKH